MRVGVSRLLLILSVLVVLGAANGAVEGVVPRDGQTHEPTENAHELVCQTVATSWPRSESGPYRLEPPQLSVVRTDLRPKDAWIFLDGRFAGRARFFNGKKGFLYLEPGTYRLEVVAEGYQTEAFVIEARPNCRFDIKQRLIKGQTDAAGRDVPGKKGDPEQWIWGPVVPASASESPPGPPGRADPSLRPDLGAVRTPSARPLSGMASLRLKVRPPAAVVSVDGVRVATGRQLELMVAPMALSEGSHRIEISAPGCIDRSFEITLAEGEEKVMNVTLDSDSD